MKATGNIRKFDELGRLVIPKEIRDAQGWKTGQAMEIFVSNEGVVLKPYRAAEERENAIKLLKNSMKFASKEVAANLEEVIEFLENN
ncbi:AbrB/MazE/SpoVT family DNA-binding domain-containing protein [Bacillus sp. BRMEA1]|uniref:AbrB/MazE/SpoVT family DNA-binding domain-containing protein n=1 Tax=Neobacillus endophyticus TaxID=2738405 RepID=UPI0015638D0C|nr:AbrB/MazE/SpoVT family DNA-binding domain-containing protein [Neobacillus endophyticus]NRD80322.1 AbrB/MazE/SpoVT family DNA-binding domain-containing protein [Neobacillus endophyticus]